MLIRDQYIEAIRRMKDRFGRERGGYLIPKDATLERCIDYAARYLYEKDTSEHYRYMRYQWALERLLADYGDHRKTGMIVHVDIGCGPGLFSWVVHDYFGQEEPKTAIELHAYDHSSEMVKLARLLWSEFKIGVRLDTTSDLEALISRIRQDGTPADMIVSFGHVLAQVSASCQKNAIAVFADILRRIRLNSSLVVAVDAQKDSADQNFRRSTGRLNEVLAARGLALWPRFQQRGSMVGVLTDRRSERT